MSNQARQPSIDPVEAFEQVTEHRDADRQPIAGALERFVTTVGHMVMWGNVALIIGIIAQVSLRYLFDVNYPKLDEIQRHFYRLTAMAGLSYTPCWWRFRCSSSWG